MGQDDLSLELQESSLRLRSRGEKMERVREEGRVKGLMYRRFCVLQLTRKNKLHPITVHSVFIPQKMSLTYANLSLSISSREILVSLNGCLSPGRLTALMGPTASGKTSLLTVLAARTERSEGIKLKGSIFIKNVQVSRWDEYKRELCFVGQDDLLFAGLTVRETLELAGKLRLPREWSRGEKMERVNRVMKDMGLIKCADTRVGNAGSRGVSGGERKRVSVAIELLQNPERLFLDECTTGLDAYQSLRVVAALKELAVKGTMVVTSIHQPRSQIFALFDDVVILSEGRTMYAGPADKMIEYFTKAGYALPENYNPADFVLDLVSMDVRTETLEEETKARIKVLGDLFASEEKKTGLDGNVSAADATKANAHSDSLLALQDAIATSSTFTYPTSFLTQFILLAQRSAKQRLRDKTMLAIPFFISVFFGLVLGLVYYQTGKNLSQAAIQDKSSLFFFCLLNQIMSSLLSVVTVFPIERQIIARERAANSYGILPYFLSKIATDLPLLAFPLVYCILVYFLAALVNTPAAFFETALIFILTYVCGNALGLVFSSFASSLETAQAMAVPIILIIVLFSGFYASTELIPPALAWLQWLSPVRWAFSALIVIQYAPLVFDCPSNSSVGCIPDGNAYIHRIGFSGDTVWRSAGVLIGLSFVLQVLAFIFLSRSKSKVVYPKK